MKCLGSLQVFYFPSKPSPKLVPYDANASVIKEAKMKFVKETNPFKLL